MNDLKNLRETKKAHFYLTTFQEFLKSQVTASVLLFLCTIIALLWASIPLFNSSYESFINLKLGVNLGSFHFNKPLQFWVNDVLLTVFFFYVGLEIKRSFIVGELQNQKQAMFVIWSAFGGMLVPAIFYSAFNINSETQSGWAIPIATDTAFVIGILTYFKKHLPKGVFTFIASLAIIDDIGAITIIAIFYTPYINATLFFLGVLCVLFLLLANYSGIRAFSIYFIFGILVWIFMELSGIQGAIFGVIVALIMPSNPGLTAKQYQKHVQSKLSYYEQRKQKKPLILEDNKQHSLLKDIQNITRKKMTPLQRWESILQCPVSLCILPLFALVNAGVPIDFSLLDDVFRERVSLGILLGLFLGKPLGVLTFGYLSVKLKISLFPENTTPKQIIAVSLLTGIGFTMSLFITNLSFTSEYHMILAKTAIFIGSLLSAIVGFFYLNKLSKCE